MVVVVIVGHFMLLDVRLDGCTILGWMCESSISLLGLALSNGLFLVVL